MKIENMREQHTAILDEEPIQLQHEKQAKTTKNMVLLLLQWGRELQNYLKASVQQL